MRPRKHQYSLVGLLCWLPVVLLPAKALTDPTPSVRAVRTELPVDLDGFLLEDLWQQADSAGDFHQIQPREGDLATERTEVHVAYDDDNLYVGVKCYDSSPDKIVAQKLQRDGGVNDDDMFAFILDTYHDRRTAYYFATNPNGVEEDGQVVDGAFRANLDWDGVWQVRSRKLDDGWSAEFRIPLWNLRFKLVDAQSWGVNFTRVIKRKTEQVNWASWSRNNGGFLRISHAGDLVGLNKLRSGRNLQVKPYTLGRSFRDELLSEQPTGKESFNAGLDIKYGITTNLTLDLTVNTDFAQVESDVNQTNLTRFSLFFPEKREFFLESASTFQFGERGFGTPQFLMFFSRRIGIDDSETITPIREGGRVTGKVGRFNVGFVDILTEAKGAAPKTHFTVARISRDIFQRSRIGVMFTNRANFGQDQNRAYGADANIWLSNSLELQSFVAQTHTTGGGNTDRAWKMALDFTKDHWGWNASHLFIDKNFDPQVGFVLRDDIRRSRFAFRVSPQPNGPLLRRTDIRQSFDHILNRAGRLQDWSYRLNFRNELSTGDFVNFSYRRRFVRLDEPFDLRDEIQIPIGDYTHNEFNFSFNSSSKRRFSTSVNARWRGFFTGDLFVAGGGLGYVPNRHIFLELNYDRNQVTLPEGNLTTELFKFRMNLAFTTQLFLNTLIQYDSEANELSTNIRLDFIHTPGSDLFVVFNENRGREGENFFAGLPTRNRAFIVKFTRFLRI